MPYGPQLGLHSSLLPAIHIKYNLNEEHNKEDFLPSIHLLHDALIPGYFGLRTDTAGLQFLPIRPYWVVGSLVLLFRHCVRISEKIKSVQISVVKQEVSNVTK